MASAADPSTLASQARRVYTEQLVKGLPGLVNGVVEAANLLRDKPAEHATAHRRRELALELHRGAASWHHAMVDALRSALLYGVSASRAMDLPVSGRDQLTLVDDDTIEREILGSRLALAMMDRASWEFSDVRARMAHLERREELEAQDMLRAHVLARIVVDAWGQSGLSLGGWRELQSSLHEAFATLAEGAYHEVNRFLAERQVLPQIDLRPLIRRQHESAPASDSGYASMTGRGGLPGGGAPSTGRGGVGDETRLMTRTPALARGQEQAEAVLTRLTRLVGRHLPGFGQGPAGGTPTTARPTCARRWWWPNRASARGSTRSAGTARWR